MGQCIHAGGSGQPLRHAGHHVGIYKSDDRDVMGIYADKLSLFFHVCNDIVDGHFRCRSCRRRNRKNRNGRLLGGGESFQTSHVFKFRVGNDDTDGLGGVHGRSSSDCNQIIRTGFLEGGHTALYVFNRRIRLNIGIHLISQTLFVQKIGDLFCHIEFHQIRIGTDKSFMKAAQLRLFRDT